MKEERLSCSDCAHYWYCRERSRDYPCTDFGRRKKNEENDSDFGSSRGAGDREPDHWAGEHQEQ